MEFGDCVRQGLQSVVAHVENLQSIKLFDSKRQVCDFVVVQIELGEVCALEETWRDELEFVFRDT